MNRRLAAQLRWRAAARRRARRSSSVVPPQMPEAAPSSSAHARHRFRTGRPGRSAWPSRSGPARVRSSRSGRTGPGRRPGRRHRHASLCAWSSGSLLMAASADDAEGKHRRAAAPHQPGDLMPVEAVGIDLRQRLGNPQAPALRRAPICARAARRGRSPPAWLTASWHPHSGFCPSSSGADKPRARLGEPTSHALSDLPGHAGGQAVNRAGHPVRSDTRRTFLTGGGACAGGSRRRAHAAVRLFRRRKRWPRVAPMSPAAATGLRGGEAMERTARYAREAERDAISSHRT